jgi:hypothetical protein
MGGADLRGVLTVFLVVFLPVLYFWSIVWAAIDAVKRDRPGCLIGLLVMLTWPLGLFIWLIARPPRAT